MRSRTVAALVAVALTVPLLGPAVAAAEPRQLAPDPVVAPSASGSPSDVLARAQALFADKSAASARRQVATSGREATMVLNDLRQVRSRLSGADRQAADALLARPTGSPSFPGEWQYTVPEETPVCGPDICVHYVATTVDAPPMADVNPDNGIPDEVDRALATTEKVHARYRTAGYRSPDRDGNLGGGNGPNRIDVYLNNVGDDGLYGYCTSDQPDKFDGTSNYWAYCVIDNDFRKAEFPTNTPRENQQVTIAHEYFHAVQYAYDANEAGWFLEATATWAEDEQFDKVNDNWNYLPFGQMGDPYTPLNTYAGLVHYGNWIFFRYLTEKYRGKTGSMPNLVLDMIKRGSNKDGEPNANAMQALTRELKQRGTTLTKVYPQFAVANRIPRKAYDEGRNYKPAKPDLVTFTGSSRAVKGTANPRHLTNVPVRFKRGRGLSGRWKLRIHVDMATKKASPAARVLVYKKSGKVAVSPIRLNRRTKGSRTVSFSSRAVKYVELVLVNASSKSNKGKTVVKARVFR